MTAKSLGFFLGITGLVLLAIFLPGRFGGAADFAVDGGTPTHGEMNGEDAEPALFSSEVETQRRPEGVSKAEPGTGRISGQVADPTQAGVSGVRVQVRGRRPGQLWTATTDDQGHFLFEALPLGEELGIGIAQSTLRAPYISPARMHFGRGFKRYGEKWPRGIFCAIVEPTEEQPHQVQDLELVVSSVVIGRVLRYSDQAPVTASTVQIAPWRQEDGSPIGGRLQVDQDGAFEARLVAGKYKVFVTHYEDKEDSNRSISAVAPFSFELQRGEHRDLGVLYIGAPGVTVAGRVVDQYGAPVADLDVLAYLGSDTAPGEPPNKMSALLCWGRTDAEGVYAVHGLPSELVKVMPGPYDWDGGSKVEGNRLRTFVEPITLDLRTSEGTEQAPEIAVFISEPFQYEMNVSAGQSGSGTLDRCHVWVDIFSPDVDDLRALRLEHGMPRRAELRGQADGFAWSCHTPHPPVVVRVRTASRRVLYETVLVPMPNGVITDPIEVAP